MGVMDVIKIDTEPARRAGELAAKAYMSGISRGLKGDLGTKMAQQLQDTSLFSPQELISLVGRYNKKIAQLNRMPVGLAESANIENRVRWKRAFKSGEDTTVSKAWGEIFGSVGAGYYRTYELTARNNIQSNIDRLNKAIPSLEKLGTKAAVMMGRPEYEASKFAEAQVEKFRNDLAAIDPNVDVTNQASVNKTIDAVQKVADAMSRYEKTRQEMIITGQKQLAIEKEFNAELREEEMLKKRLISLTDKYYQKTGLNPSQRAQYTDAINQKYTRRLGDSQTHAAVMSGLRADILDTQTRLEALPTKKSSDFDKYARKLEGKWSKLESAWRRAYGSEGMNIVNQDAELRKMQDAYLASIRNATTMEQLRQIDASGRLSHQAAIQRRYDATTTGYMAMRAAARDRMSGVLSRYQTAITAESGAEDGRFKRDVAKRELNRMFRQAESKNDIRLIDNYLNALDNTASSITAQGVASKKATTALNDFRKKTVNELDEISRLGDMFHATRREFGLNPFRNNRFFQTHIGIPGLPYIPVGRRDRLNEQKDYIRHLLDNAKDEAEINAIRKRFLFDERRQSYTQDLHMRERSNFLRVRDANGSLTPTIDKIQTAFMRHMRILAASWVGVMWLRMLYQPFAAGFSAVTGAADEHTRQRNMYNVTLGYNFTKGRTFEQWEDESFDKARDLRMKASEYRQMVMNAAPIFHTAVYGEDYKAGKVGVDGVTHKQGERIITNMQQVETISTNLHRMAKISGTTDVEMQAAMRQIIQMVSKGRGNIQDIRPILESGGHMGEMIARFGFRANGAADLYGLNEKRHLTADRLLTNLLDEKTTKDLDNLMRRTRRTWEDTWAIFKTDMNQLFMPTIRSFASSNQYGLGDKILGYSGAIAQNKEFQDKILQFTDNVVTNLIEKWPDYVEQGIQTFGVVALIATYVGSLLKAVNTALGWIAGGWTSKQAAHRYDDVFENVTGKSTLVDNGMLQTATAINMLGGNLDRPQTNFMTMDWARSASEQISKYADMSDEEIAQRAKTRRLGGAYYTEKYMIDEMTQARDMLKQLRDRSSVIDDMGAYTSMTEMRDRVDKRIDEMHESLQNMAFSALSTGKISNLIKAGEEQKQKIEDSYLPEQAVFMNNVATGVGNIDKNTRKATQVQLAILKQVAGTRTINRVVHVSPNIVANVGTIRNGIEYEQLLKDLGTTVNHAVTAYAL